MKKYCMYLRKSRSDMEAEKHGEGETLAVMKKLYWNWRNGRTYLYQKYIVKSYPEKH